MDQICSCSICEIGNITLNDWIKHFFDKHMNKNANNNFSCVECKIIYPAIGELMHHFIIRHSRQYTICNKCGHTEHKIHSENKHECELCPKCDQPSFTCFCMNEEEEEEWKVWNENWWKEIN